MPIDYSKYPPNWKTEIRPAILERDGHCCKFCGVPNYQWVNRFEDGSFLIGMIPNVCMLDIKTGNWKRPIKIILTVAHLDHDTTNNDPKNLAALCQRCHLRYDSKHHAMNSKATRDAKKEAKTGQIKLF